MYHLPSPSKDSDCQHCADYDFDLALYRIAKRKAADQAWDDAAAASRRDRDDAADRAYFASLS